MDPRFSASREDLYNLQMEVKQVQYTQTNHAERLLRLEKRQADDAALKSVWNSPFPGVLSSTPQTGPVSIPHNDMFEDLDEQGEQLLGSLHLGPAEEEPARRGAASRANSVRFDESALHGSSWGGQSHRHSGDFGPVRPGSGLMMERSSSHKSDGRHSSAGHSVHSVHSVHSHHSIASGRASSLGLDNNFAVEDDDDESFDIPGPPPGFFILGTVPAIVRCWLTPNFGHATLLYADVCSGSQRSIVEYSLLVELDLLDEIQRDADGAHRIRLNVYFAEAVVTHHGSRSGSPRGPVPSITVAFEVTGVMDQSLRNLEHKAIRVYLGSDALRAHSADILFSQNTMTLYGSERDRLQIPFVRPEDDAVFRNICTTNVVPEKPKLNAHATPFVSGEASQISRENIRDVNSDPPDETRSEISSMVAQAVPSKSSGTTGSLPDVDAELDKPSRILNGLESGAKEEEEEEEEEEDEEGRESAAQDGVRESAAGIWGSWRQGPLNGTDGPQRDNGLLSGYQPAGRSSRNMKVLKPLKSNPTSTNRVGVPYEQSTSAKDSVDARRKSQSHVGEVGANGNAASRWEAKRVASVGSEAKSQPPAIREVRNINTLPRSANPVGVASAFSWMTPISKAKTTADSG